MGFGNVQFSYRNAKGKPVFAPTEAARRDGYRLKALLEKSFVPEEFYYHLRRGGHVAALHAHRRNRHFARVDLENFFYSIGRNRVVRVLKNIGLRDAVAFGSGSTVKNPYGSPSYALPYGFVQSPLLATVVLAQSDLGRYLKKISTEVTVTVYVDDIAISSNNKRWLKRFCRTIETKAVRSGFRLNRAKCIAPGPTITLFNCQLSHLRSLVSEERRAEFGRIPRTPASQEAFSRYCEIVEA